MAAPGLIEATGSPHLSNGPSRLSRADWSAPWFDAVADHARTIDWSTPAAALDALDARAARGRLCTGAGRPLRFTAAALGDDVAYERQIAQTGCVPTRMRGDGFVHDALSALMWLAMPHAKAALNALQAGCIARDGIGARRGAQRDEATLLDENGLVLALRADAPDARDAVRALRERRWRAALVQARGLWHAAIVPVAFGHALLQKLLDPFEAVTAHAWPIDMPSGWFALDRAARLAALDAAVAARIEPWSVDRCARMPLPVLGIPGWWAPNAQPAFYDDEQVFRRGHAVVE